MQTASQPNIISLGTLTGLTISDSLTSSITDTGTGTLLNPLVISHLLSSGTPTINSFGVGMVFNAPNSNNTTKSYGRIHATIQDTTSNAHKGSLNFSTVYGGNFVTALSLTSQTSANDNLLQLNGSTS